jgi:hypothetical protein
MNKLNSITVAATLIAAAATASAQNTLMANVPFSFKVNAQTVLPAGDYNVTRPSVNPTMWVFEDRASGKKTMVAIGQSAGSRVHDAAKLEFQCREERCSLTKIQVGDGQAGYEIRAPKPGNGEPEQAVLRTVPLTRGNAE